MLLNHELRSFITGDIKAINTIMFISEATGSRTQRPEIAAVKAVRQYAHNQKLKIAAKNSRTHWKSPRALIRSTATKPNPNEDINV